MSSRLIKDPLREWRESAPYWARNASTVRSMFAPITTALIESTQINAGETILDVAGGSGEPSIALAESIGPKGLVLCTDAVKEMVGTSRLEARARGLQNIEFAQCLGASLPFRANQFDAVICRLGIMLFTDPKASAREMLRVVKPGRAVVCAVWHLRETNPFFQIVADTVSRYVDSPAESPDDPGAFRYAVRGKLARLFSECGATVVDEHLLKFSLNAEISIDQYWTLRLELSDTLREKVTYLSEAQLRTLIGEIEEASLPFFSSGQMRFPAQVLIVRSTK